MRWTGPYSIIVIHEKGLYSLQNCNGKNTCKEDKWKQTETVSSAKETVAMFLVNRYWTTEIKMKIFKS